MLTSSLLLLALLAQLGSISGKTFSKLDFPSNFWAKQPALTSNFAGCSLACLKMRSKCQMFAWDSGLCTLGAPAYAPGDAPATMEEVFVDRKESHEMRMQAALNFDWERWNATGQVYKHFYEYGELQFWKSGRSHRLSTAIQHCQETLNGRLMDNLHQRDIYHFVTTVVLEAKVNRIVPHRFFWIGLDRRVEEGCSGQDCQPRLIWDDGTLYNETGPGNSCFNFTAGEPEGMAITWNQCGTTFDWFYVTHQESFAKYVCLVNKN